MFVFGLCWLEDAPELLPVVLSRVCLVCCMRLTDWLLVRYAESAPVCCWASRLVWLRLGVTLRVVLRLDLLEVS